MSMTLSGNGTITGLVSGGLPDGTILPADLSTGGPNWDTSGNLGIGVTPSAWGAGKSFEIGVAGNGLNAANSYVSIVQNTVFSSGAYRYAVTGVAPNRFDSDSGAFRWFTAPSGTAGNAITFTQAMTLDANGLKINATMGTGTTPFQIGYTSGGTYYPQLKLDDNGNLLVGTTSPVYPLLKLSCYQSAAHHVGGFKNGSDGYGILFLGNTDGIGGSITWSNVSCAYTTSSDYRLKEDYQPVADAIARLNQLKPVNFAWKADGSRCDGFLAHELQEVIPEAATGHKDEMRTEEYEVTPAINDEEGNVITEAVMGEREVPVYQGIDQSKIVPLLTAALQELIKEVADLKAEVASLKGEQ